MNIEKVKDLLKRRKEKSSQLQQAALSGQSADALRLSEEQEEIDRQINTERRRGRRIAVAEIDRQISAEHRRGRHIAVDESKYFINREEYRNHDN